MYGITKEMRQLAREKIKRQKDFLDRYYIEVGDQKIYLSQLVKNSFINTKKYIAEINHRVYSLYEYAKERDLVNVFFTLTLPTEWHRKRVIKLKNGQKKMVRNDRFEKIINGLENTPRNGVLELSKMFAKILRNRAYYSIPKSDRVYFRVVEPHKDGTPHLHVSFFIPRMQKERFVKMLKRNFPYPLGKVIEDVENPVAYLMKYILKTFDDLRENPDNYTDLTLWYIYWGIPRMYTSRTLISLDVYRLLGGRYTLKRLTDMYRSGDLEVYIDNKTKKILEIIDDNPFGAPIYRRRKVIVKSDKSYEPMPRRIYSRKELQERSRPIPIYVNGELKYYIHGGEMFEPSLKNVKIPKYMNDFELLSYYRSLDPEDPDLNYIHFAIVQNEVVDRNLIDEEIEYIPIKFAERIQNGSTKDFD